MIANPLRMAAAREESQLVDEHEPGARLWAMADLGTPMAIRVAATLRIADHIAAGLTGVRQIADAAHADPDAVGRLMRHLAAKGVLDRDPSGRYTLTACGEALRDDHPSGMRTILDIEGGAGRAELAVVQLLHSIRTGTPAYPVQFGGSIWEDLASDPVRACSFNTAMSLNLRARAPDIVAAYDWGSLGHVVDVGGGDGSLLIALLTAYPTLTGTAVDLPDAAATAARALADAGLADRGDAVRGTFFDPLPAGAGGYILSSILHDWGDADARRILRRCAEAANGRGAVFVVERTGGDGRSIRTGLDLRMLTWFGGRERGIEEVTALAARAGLSVAALHPAGSQAIIELRPAAGPINRSISEDAHG